MTNITEFLKQHKNAAIAGSIGFVLGFVTLLLVHSAKKCNCNKKTEENAG